jgi:hypothetical protein
MLCPNCKSERDRQEHVIVRGVGVEVCSICVEQILWNVRGAKPEATLDLAVRLADHLIDEVVSAEIWKVTERGRHRHGRPRKEVLDVLFVGLVAAMVGDGVEATLKRIDPIRVSGPISSRTVTRELAAPAFLPVLVIGYKRSIEHAAIEANSPEAISVDPTRAPEELAHQLNAILRIGSGGWKTAGGRLAKLLCMATGHNLKLWHLWVMSDAWLEEVDAPKPESPATKPAPEPELDEPIPAIMLL